MKNIYWVSTLLISAFLLLSSFTYLFHQNTIEGFKALGFPDFFRIELVILKIIAAFVLLIPAIPMQVKEWAYAGVMLFILTGLVAHIAHKDSAAISIMLIVFGGILLVSNYSLHKISD